MPHSPRPSRSPSPRQTSRCKHSERSSSTLTMLLLLLLLYGVQRPSAPLHSAALELVHVILLPYFVVGRQKARSRDFSGRCIPYPGFVLANVGRTHLLEAIFVKHILARRRPSFCLSTCRRLILSSLFKFHIAALQQSYLQRSLFAISCHNASLP